MPVRFARIALLFAVTLAQIRESAAGAFMLEPGTGQFIAGVGYKRH